jgi:thiol:disulfide interchange protein DsbD
MTPIRPLLVTLLLVLAAHLVPSSALAQPDRFGSKSSSPFAVPAAETPKVVVTALVSTPQVRPGDQAVIAVVLDHATHWHTQSHAGDALVEGQLATTITATIDGPAASAAQTGPVQWPPSKPFLFDFGFGPKTIRVFEGRSIAYVPVLIAPDAQPGQNIPITLDVFYQACDDTTCEAPQDRRLTVNLDVVAADAVLDAPAPGPDFAAFNPAVFADADAWGSVRQAQDAAAAALAPTSGNFFGIPLPNPASPVGLIVFGLLGVLGGVILNLTPCVLPVIPLKIMSITKHAGHPGRSVVLGLWMALGVVAFWAALGVVAITFTGLADPSRIFGYWWVTAGIGLLIAVMGVGIMGAFQINLPQSLYAINPKADTAWGSFLFGVMTAVLGLPCFGFVAGALLAGSATMPTLTILSIFGGIGVGMAAPYLILSLNPRLVKSVPKAGPASDLVKQVMGLLLLAAAAYFIGSGLLTLLASAHLPWWAKAVHWWAVAVLVGAAGAWMLWRTIGITKRPLRRGVIALAALVLGALGVLSAVSATQEARSSIWRPWTAQAEADALASGRVVVMDFTASWCLNCKALKAAVLNRDPVKARLLDSGVVPLTVDLSSTDAPGWERLRELGRTGIPTLVVRSPRGAAPDWIANAYTPEQVVGALDVASTAPPAPTGG